MPLTPEQKSQRLTQFGYDPKKYQLEDDDQTVSERDETPVVQDTTVSVAPPTQPKMGALQAAGTSIPRSIIPTLGGFGGATIAAALAPETGGLSLLLPLLGGFGGGYVAGKAQEAILPASPEEQARLAKARSDQPVASAVGEMIPSLIAMKPSLNTLGEAAGGLRQLTTKGLGNAVRGTLSNPQAAALLNMGIGSAVGAGSEIASAKMAGEDVDPKRVLVQALGNALISDPNIIGRKVFGFHGGGAPTERPATIENSQGVDLTQYRAPVVEEAPRVEPVPVEQPITPEVTQILAHQQQRIDEIAKAYQELSAQKASQAYEDATLTPASTNAKRYLEPTIERNRLAEPEVRPVEPVDVESRTKLTPEEVNRPMSEAERIQDEYDRGIRNAEGGTPTTADEVKAQLKEKSVETSGLLNQDTRKLAAKLSDRLGYKYQETTQKMVDPKTGKEVPGRAFVDKLISEVNPTAPNKGEGERGFGLDTPIHEPTHIFIEEMRQNGTPFEKRVVQRGEELFGGNENLVRDAGLKEVYNQYSPTSPQAKYLKLLWKHIKLRFGAGSKQDYRDWLLSRMMEAPSKEQQFTFGGRPVASVGNAAEKKAEGGSELPDKGKATYLGEQERGDGTSFSLYNTPDGSTVTAETLKKLGLEVPPKPAEGGSDIAPKESERKVSLASTEGQSRMAKMRADLGVEKSATSAQDKKALATLPQQKLAEGGSDISHVQRSVEEVAKDKHSFAPVLTSQVNKVREHGPSGDLVADASTKYLAARSRYEGQLGEGFKKVVQDMNLGPKYDVLATKYLHNIQDGKPQDVNLPPEIVAKIDQNSEFRKFIQGIADFAAEKGVRVTDKEGNTRLIRKDPNYIPNMLADEVASEWSKNPNSPKSKKFIEQYARRVMDKDTEISDITDLNERYNTAYTLAKQYANAVAGGKAHDSAEFAALRRAAGIGLPWDMTEHSLERLAQRYGRRAAKDIAFHEMIQSDRATLKAFGLRDSEGKMVPENEVHKLANGNEVERIGGKDVEALKRTVLDEPIQDLPRIKSFSKLTSSMIMQTPTGLRDVASIPLNALPYTGVGEGLRHSIKAIQNIAADWRGAVTKTRLAGAARSSMSDYIAGDTDRIKNNVDKMAAFFSKWSGREGLETAARTFTYHLGEEVVKARLAAARSGDKSAQQWLGRFGDSIKEGVDTYAKPGSAMPTPEIITKLSKEFVDAVQGGYDARNLPTWALEGSVAPFVSLQRWSIEKANTVYKDVIKPLKKGDYAPFLRYSLGGLLTGVAIEQLNQMLSNSRGYDPSTEEVLKSDEAGATDYAKKFVSLMQMASYGGIVSDVAKLAVTTARGDYTKYNSPLNYPLYSYLTDTLAKNTSDYVAAMKSGEDPIETTAQFVKELTTQSLQNARVMKNYIEADETKRREMNRDVRVWKELRGDSTPQPPDLNRFIGRDERKFKQTTDPEEAISLGSELVDKALNEEDPMKTAQKLSSLRRMPISWSPSMTENPRDFLDYVEHVRKTKGDQAASNILDKYQKQVLANQAKQTLVPALNLR